MDRVHNNSPGSQQPMAQAHKSLSHQLLWMLAPAPSDPIPHLPGSVISALGDNIESVIALLIGFFSHCIFSLMDGSTDGIVG